MSELQVALIFLISSCSKDLLQELRCVSMWSHGLALCSDGQLQRNCMVHPCSLLHGPGARHQGFPNFLCSCANNCRGCCVVVISTHAAWFSLCSHGQLQRCCMDIPPPCSMLHGAAPCSKSLRLQLSFDQLHECCVIGAQPSQHGPLCS